MAPSYSLLRGGHGTNCAADSDDGECRVIFLVQSSMFVNKDKITLLAGLIPKLYLLAKLLRFHKCIYFTKLIFIYITDIAITMVWNTIV